MTTSTGVEAVAETEKAFDDAFGEAVSEAGKTTQEVEVKLDAPAEKAIEPKVDTEAEKAAAAEQVKADEATRVAALTPEAKAVEEADKKTAQDATDATARLQAKADADEAARRTEAARVAAEEAARETPEQKTAREAVEASIKPYEPTEDEKKALETFKREFPESAVALEAQLKSTDREMNKKVHDAVSAVLAQIHGRMAPIETGAAEQAQAAHVAALYKAHADYDAVVPKLAEWIKTQPALFQPALQKAYDAGSTQDVLDLVATYKGSVKTAPTGETAAQLAAREAAADAKKKADEEAASLVAVKSKRTVAGPKGTVDKDDFDGAFAEASAAADGK